MAEFAAGQSAEVSHPCYFVGRIGAPTDSETGESTIAADQLSTSQSVTPRAGRQKEVSYQGDIDASRVPHEIRARLQTFGAAAKTELIKHDKWQISLR